MKREDERGFSPNSTVQHTKKKGREEPSATHSERPKLKRATTQKCEKNTVRSVERHQKRSDETRKGTIYIIKRGQKPHPKRRRGKEAVVCERVSASRCLPERKC